MDKSIVEIRKLASKYKNTALNKKRQQQEICYLCGKSSSSFADSHSVPISSLRSISEDGFVIGGGINATLDIVSDTAQGKLDYFYKTGISKAGVFQNICQSCENTMFQTIEDEKYFYMIPWSKEQLIRVALKSLLYENNIITYKYHLYLESFLNDENNIVLKRILDNLELECLDQLNSLFLYIQANMFPDKIDFEVIIDEALDYETNFAMNSLFFPCHDGNLKSISKNNNHGLLLWFYQEMGKLVF